VSDKKYFQDMRNAGKKFFVTLKSLRVSLGSWAYAGGFESHPKNFEPCSWCGSNFFGWGPDPPGYAPV